MGALFALTLVLWVTESIPIAVTALLAVALQPLFGVADIRTVAPANRCGSGSSPTTTPRWAAPRRIPRARLSALAGVSADGRSLENAEIGSPPTASENVPSPMATSGGGTGCWDWRTS